MKRKILAVACSLTLLVAVGACKKKQEPGAPMTGAPGQQQQLPPGHPVPGAGGPGGVVMPKGETTVSVPDSVKGKWKAVVLAVEDKETKKTSEHTVNLNSELKLPNSKITVKVSDFLPDFKMDGLNITSMSNEPNNPAVKVVVTDGDKEIFKGWLYSKFPTIHPFEHAKYGLVLKSGVKKG
ncbi:MAG: DUF2155 domain-containing protein [Nitrospiraceae bacterium]|nr:DUF2155 domain-containing protein [Nitrospiraceae bacterium]